MCGENRFNNFIYYVRNYMSRESSMLGDVERRICDEEMDEARKKERKER